MPDLETKLHQTAKGKWVPCTASVRPCPRGNHVMVSGDQKSAAEFFNSLGLKDNNPAILPSEAGPKRASVEDIESILRNEFKGVAVGKRENLAKTIHAELQAASEYKQTQAGYREIYGRVANSIAHVYERENTKGSPNSAARRIFLANGWRTTFAPFNRGTLAPEKFRVYTQETLDKDDTWGLYPQDVSAGDLLKYGDTYYEVMEVKWTADRMVNRQVEKGKVTHFVLNPAYTEPKPHIRQSFPIEVKNQPYRVVVPSV